MIALGIDPGVTGGIAAVCSRRGLLDAARIPSAPAPWMTAAKASAGKARNVVDGIALRRLLQGWSAKHGFGDADDVLLVIERMATFGGPDAGKDNAPRGTLLSMGHSAGLCEGIALPFVRRTMHPLPQQWKSTYGLVIRRAKIAGIALPPESTTERKQRAHRVALMLYPQMGKVPHDVAEAVLIAHFGLGTPTLVASPQAQVRPYAPNTGHGHVRPRPDGVKARCGGPALCAVCQRESAEAGPLAF